MLECFQRAGRAVLILLIACSACVDVQAAVPDWHDFLRRGSIEAIRISPNGDYLALAERVPKGTLVIIRDRRTLEVLQQFDSGEQGEISVLRWLDNDRLIVGANRVHARYQVALANPQLLIVSRVNRTVERLPANFLATIDDDPDHLLVTDCNNYQKGGCIDDVRRVQVGHTLVRGEKIVAAPDVASTLVADQKGNVRFAISWNDKSQSRLHVYKGTASEWTLLNDATVSGIDSLPLGFDQDGRCAYLSTERKQGPSVVERYCIADGTRQDIYADPDSDPALPIFALDGTVPIGAYYGATQPRAVIWNPGHPDAPILQKLINSFPHQMVVATSASKDRNLIVVKVSSDKDPGSLYLFDGTTNKAALIARTHPWLAQATMPTTQGFSFQARDGLTLHGLLTLPAGAEAGKALPMVVIPHGGPYEVIDAWGYDAEAALIASQGYAVLRVNFRGSGGYGRDFIEKGYREWGRAMQDDVTDATRWAIEQGHAAADRICIYGASYGGYAALMGAVREPTLYRCAAGFAAPYDLAKMYKWGSIRRSDLGLNYLERVLGKDKDDLAARSPAKQAPAIHIPVLLAHGQLDPWVDIQHSRAMVRALRKDDTDVEFVDYQYEGHGLAIQEDQVDFYTRLLAFLSRHTQAQ